VPYTGAAASFNTAAEQYDSARPSYPSALIKKIIATARLKKSSQILEIGAGTGKASVLFAQYGYKMLCLEPGEQMGEIAKRNLKPFKNVRVVTKTFEDWRVQKNTFDLVISAQAFHWIDPTIGFPKVAKALKPGGWVAVFWNLPNDPSNGIYAEIQEQYRKYVPSMERRFKEKPLSEEVRELREELADHKNLFAKRAVYRFSWKKRYTSDEYVALLGTYSDHIALPTRRQNLLYKGIRNVIDSNGGTHLKHYTCVVAMGQKSST